MERLRGGPNFCRRYGYGAEIAIQSIETDSEFEFDGFWWEPTSAPEPSQAPGHLTYLPSRGIEVSVIDLHPNPHDFFDDAKAIPVLLGTDLHGKPCTLFDVLPKDSTFYSASGHSREVLQSNRLIHGLHLDDIDDLRLDHAVVSVRGLREWVNYRWHGTTQAAEAATAKSSSSDPLENEVLNVPLDGGRLLIQRGASIGQKKVDVPVTAQFKLDERIPYEEFTERFVKPLRDLITFTTREPTEVEAITILYPREMEKWWGDEKPIQSLKDVQVVERTTLTRLPRREREFALIPMPLRAWGSVAPEVIGRWFEQRARLGGPGNLLFATLAKRDVHLENDLLGLLSVAEGYHRGRFDDPPFTAVDHRAALKTMVDALGEKLQVDHYRARLQHANQQSQKQRVRCLYDRAEEILAEVGGWRQQLQGLIDTRNFLTHWDAPTANVLEGWDLWAALNRLRIVIEINLYLDLEIHPDVVEVAIRTANHRRDFMDSP